MKKFKVTFRDEIEAESEEEVYKNIRDYCAMVYNSGDVTAFKFEEIKEDEYICSR
jgi:hypothetical protein